MNIGVILARKGFTDKFRTSICSHPNRLKSIIKIWPDSQFNKITAGEETERKGQKIGANSHRGE